jgi:iron complex outermembrane receptor protein
VEIEGAAMWNGKGKWLFFCLLSVYVNGEIGNVDSLLNDYSRKNALSKETIDENKGHLILFTREQLERMRAHSLKDVFKTTPVIYYHENRYALPDPLSGPSFSPYLSSFIRIYIDGVEITQGWMGSGLLLYGDMNIDFADHIEFYYAIPSFETSVEPAYMTIFIYSKDAKRDAGGKLNISQSSRGGNEQVVSYMEHKNGISYMVNISRTDDRRSKVMNGTYKLSRDYRRLQLISYIKSESQRFHLNILTKKADGLAGISLDATPIESKQNYLNIHTDYDMDMNEKVNLKFAFDRLHFNGRQSDDAPFFFKTGLRDGNYHIDYDSILSTYSSELTYKDNWNDHHLALGIKGRIKVFDKLKTVEFGDIVLPFDKESIYSIFLQDQYFLSERHLLTFGVEGIRVSRNIDTLPDNDLLQMRIGYIFNGDSWGYKTYLYRMMFTPDAYLYYFNNKGMSDSAFQTPQKTLGLTQEIRYGAKRYDMRLLLFLAKDEKGLLQGEEQEKTKYFFSVFEYNYRLSFSDMIKLQLYYAHYKNIFNLNELDDWSGYGYYSGSSDTVDYYVGLVWHRNSLDYKDFFDVNLALTWNVSESFTIALKGENLLDKSKETGILRVNPFTFEMMEPLSVSPIDRRISLELEYTF